MVAALPAAMLLDDGPGEPSAEIRARVERARERQIGRVEDTASPLNAHLCGPALSCCRPDGNGRRLLAKAVDALGLSARGHDRVLRVARTIADLAGEATVRAEHVAEALLYRSPVPAGPGTAAG